MKLAVAPWQTVLAVGCVVIVGNVFTVNTALLDSTVGLHAPVTKQVYVAASVVVIDVNTRLDVVAPLIFPPFTRSTPPFFH